MNKLQEERGYTLIVVLLTIVLFLGVSTIFIKASIGHAYQEKSVDKNNHAVVAAEMGIEYNTSYLAQQLPEAFNEVILNSELKSLVNDLNNCRSDCNLIKDKIETKALNLYITELQKKLDIEVSKDSKTIDVMKDRFKYSLQSAIIKPITVGETNKKMINVDLSVLGTNGSANKTLDAIILIPIPKFVGEKLVDTIENVEGIFDVPENLPTCNTTGSGIINNPCKLGAGKSLMDLMNNIPEELRSEMKIVVDDLAKALCKSGTGIGSNSVCEPYKPLGGMTIYSKDPSPNSFHVNFGNNDIGLNWYHEGTVQVNGPMNNSESIFVFEKLIASSPFNDFDGTIVLMGSKAIKEVLQSGKKIKPDHNGKMCLNLSSLTRNDLDNVKKEFDFSGGSKGNVYYYINTPGENLDNFTLHHDKKVIKITDANMFLDVCNLKPVQSSTNTEFEDFIFPELDTEIDYNPQ